MATPVAAIDVIESGAPLAPTGVTRIIRSGGMLQQSTDGQAYSQLGGSDLTTSYPLKIAGSSLTSPGIPANWFASTVSFAQSVNPALNAVIWTAEMTPNPAAAEVEVTGSSALLTTVDGGVLDVVNAGLCRNKNGHASPANFITSNMKTGSWAVGGRAKIIATGAGAALIITGLSDEVTLTVAFGVNISTSATNLAFTSTSSADLGVAFTVGTYLDYMMIANGTHIQCYLGDGTGTAYVAVGSPQDQTVLPTDSGHWIADVTGSATGHFQVDKAIGLAASPS
jgi:hypothetical protein